MEIEKIKKEMLKFKDLYGGELLESDKIEKAKTEKDLVEIIESHRTHLEMMANDASRNLDRLKERLGLRTYD